MTQEAITIAGWTFYPSSIKDSLSILGGGIRRAPSGKAYRKITAKKKRIVISWDALSPEELHILGIALMSVDAGAVDVVCASRSINGKFIQSDETRTFEDLGESDYKAFSITFEEQ